MVYLFQVPYESDVASTESSRMDSIGRERDSYRIDGDMSKDQNEKHSLKHSDNRVISYVRHFVDFSWISRETQLK